MTHREEKDHEIQSGRAFSADGCALPGIVRRAGGSAILDRDADTESGYGLLYYSVK